MRLFLICLVAIIHIGNSKTKTIQKIHNFNKACNSVTFEKPVTLETTVAKSDDIKPLYFKLAIMGCCFSYASNYIITKHLQEHLQPTFVTWLRFLLASIVFWPSVIFRNKSCDIWKELHLYFASIELGIWCTFGFIAQAFTISNTSAGKVSVFSSLSVILPPLFDFIKKRGNTKRNDKPKVIERQKSSIFINFLTSSITSPLIAIVGAIIMEWGGIEKARFSDILLLITPISFALAFWKSEQLAISFPNEVNVITGIMLTTVALVCYIWSFYKGEMPISRLEWLETFKKIWFNKNLLLGFFTTAFVTTSLVSVVEQYALRVISAAETTLIYSLEPFLAILFGWLFVGEKITIQVEIAAVLIIIACWWDFARHKFKRKHLN